MNDMLPNAIAGMHIGIVVSDDFDYGPDLVDSYIKAGLTVTLYLSQPLASLYMWGTGDQKGETNSQDLIRLLHERGVVPENCQIRLFKFPRTRDPRSLSAVRNLKQVIHEDALDIVHILMGPGELWIAVLACLIRDIPVVSTMIIPKPNLGESLPAPIPWIIAKLLTLGSDIVIVNGRDQVELVSRLYKVQVNKLAFIPLGPRIAALKWADTNPQEEPGMILFPGKAQPRKGLEYLIRAQPKITACVPHARIVVAAHGEEIERCKAMIEDESKFEIHDGFLTGADLAGYFQRASLVALPYLTASTSGLLNTAYVFGKPVVATQVGSLPEYVENGVTGLLVPPADADQLADAIIRLLSDEGLRHQMGENARSWAITRQLFVANETLKVYKKAQSLYAHM
ncbi:MAG: glycosyltransferase family 4 protein [Chloroflexi bacterium]|nr:glycosyltransferase family 4 protein [Chloroflexota bacterium]